MTDTTGDYASATVDGFTVASNSETADEIKENLGSEEKPKDGEAPDPKIEAKEKVSKAASELGKEGGKASAEKRAAEAKGTAKEAKAEKEPKEGTDEPKEGTKEGKEKPLGKPHDDPRARMLDATRKEAEAKRQLAAARQDQERLASEVAELRAQVEKVTKPAEAAEKTDSKPEEKDYAEYADFVEARSRWAAKDEYSQLEQKRAVEQRARHYANQVRQTVESFRENLTKADVSERIAPEVLDLKPTFTLEANQRPGPENVLADEILVSPKGPDIMLYLSEHPDDLQGILRLGSAREIQRVVAILETRIGAAMPQPVVAQKLGASQAKAPIKPMAGSVATTDDDLDDDASFDEHFKRMNSKDKSKRAGR